MVVLSPVAFDLGAKRMAVAGDWHGQTPWATAKIRELSELNVGIILHLGDFGIWHGDSGKRYLDTLEKELALADMHIWVTPGNHEDWGRMEELWKNKKRLAEDGSKLPIQIREHIQVQPRGWRFELAGLSFMSFGGAASVDFEYRTKDRDWWLEELPSWEEVEQASSAGYADILLAHETVNAEYAPHAVFNILARNDFGWSVDALAYSSVSRKRVTKLFEEVKPLIYFHGHMHAHGVRRVNLGSAYDSLVVSVDKDFEPHNVYILDPARIASARETGDFELAFYTPGQLKEESWRNKVGIEL